MSFVNVVFGACCLAMNRMAMMFGSDYETVNVILFDFIEPGLVVVAIVAAVMSFFGRTRNVARGIGWGTVAVVAAVVVVLVASFAAMIPMVSFHPLTVLDQRLLVFGGQPDGSFIHKVYDWTVGALIDGGKATGTTYNQINLILYVLVMPIVILAGQIVALWKK